MQELGNAINDSLSESDRIAEAIGEIKRAGYDVFLVAATHNALAVAGQLQFALLFVAAAVAVAVVAVYFVLRPIRMLARDARRIAQGNFKHRVEWSSRDSFGVIAAELNRRSEE